MKGSNSFLAGAACLLLGFFVGRTFAPPALVFPDPSQARTRNEMEAAVLRALEEPRAFPRASSLIRLFEGLTPTNVSGAASVFESRATHQDPADLQLFLTAWAHIDGGSAMQAVRAWKPRTRSDLGIRIVMREWAASGAKIEAAGFFQTLNDPEIRRVASGPLVRGWAMAGDSEGARDIALQMWALEPRVDVSEALVRGVLQVGGVDGLLSLIDGLPDLSTAGAGFDRRIAQSSIALAALERPAETAARYAALEEKGDVSWLGDSVKRISKSWLRSDAPAALDWLAQRNSSSSRNQMLMDGMRIYARDRFDEAKALLEEPADSTNPDALEVEQFLLDSLLRHWARVDPEAAAEWLPRVTNPVQRAILTSRIVLFWGPKDPAAASAWLAAQELTPEQREEAEQALKGGRSIAPDPSPGGTEPFEPL